MSASAAISTGRKRLAHAAIALIIGGSLASIATDIEYWPFSQYPMYSQRLKPGPIVEVELVGIATGDQAREVPMKSPGYIRPFDWVRLRRAMERLIEGGDRDRLQAALQDLLVRYEARRLAGHSHRPALLALRLYRYRWDEVSLSAPKTRERISRRELVMEVRPTAQSRWIP